MLRKWTLNTKKYYCLLLLLGIMITASWRARKDEAEAGLGPGRQVRGP